MLSPQTLRGWKMALEVEWKGHTVAVSGSWNWRWLFLTPTYELHIDDEFVDRIGGPRIHPRLEAMVEDESGEVHHITARSEEHTSELQSRPHLVCRLLLEKKKKERT